MVTCLKSSFVPRVVHGQNFGSHKVWSANISANSYAVGSGKTYPGAMSEGILNDQLSCSLIVVEGHLEPSQVA